MEKLNNNVRDVNDFEYWKNLAKADPSAFEEARKQVIEEFLASVPVECRDRMVRLQWRVDMERQRARNPMDAAIRIYDMMWESVGKSVDALEALSEMLPGALPNKAKAKGKPKAPEVAKVLAFPQQATGTSS